MPTNRRRVTVNLPDELAAKLDGLSAESGLSLSSLIVAKLANEAAGRLVRRRGLTSNGSRSSSARGKKTGRVAN